MFRLLHRPVWRLTAVITASLMLYPPWSAEVGGGEVVTAGYSFLWEPPEEYLQVDTTRLLLQVMALVCVAIAVDGVLNFRSRHKNSENHSNNIQVDQQAIPRKGS